MPFINNKPLSIFTTSLLLLSSGAAQALQSAATIDPYAINDGQIPSKAEYNGPLWRVNHDYSQTTAQSERPWTKVLNGKPLNKDNAQAYIEALKQAVAKDMRVMVTKPKEWNSTDHNWYSMLWAGEAIEKSGWEGREAIYGTYTGQILPAATYAESGLKVDIRNHATIYYNTVAANTLQRVWQKCHQGQKECAPTLDNNAAQFDEGSLVVKSAGVTASGEQWPVMQGAATWQIYRPPFDLHGTIPGKPPVVTNIYVGIFDIIVKDSVASPETGWVFTTLVYDKDAPGNDAWDRMVPFGAMWGNDPDVNSAQHPDQALQQTYVNPAAPAYSKVTLGYGGRLSGPFDIAVKTNVNVDGKIVPKLASSSCLSCHGTSSFHPGSYQALTFFYPVKMPLTTPWTMYTPGSVEWNDWFQNRPGTLPQSKESGAIALDYSTFMEGALMNYAAVETDKNPHLLQGAKEDFWETWRNWQKARKH
ncbi:MAG: hypothetical protein PHE96_07365 [Methylococcales bacterium]|nr:hypothetical protein [Methylococcales bacterium]